MEKALLQEALKTTNADIYEDEDFLELIDRFNCRSRVQPVNIYGVVPELAQQELIQKPYLMVCTWTNTLKWGKDFDWHENVITFYAKVKPTTKRLRELFYSNPKTEGNRASYRFFMQYIRSLEDFESTKLLWFFTGSDTIIIENIEVPFSAMEGLARRPIIHTCAPMLELPNSYRNVCELREEFTSVMNAGDTETDSLWKLQKLGLNWKEGNHLFLPSTCAYFVFF